MEKIDILGVGVHMVNMEQAVNQVMGFLKEDGTHSVYTPNSEIIMAAYRDSEFCKVLNEGDLVVADGIGVVYASKILKASLPERVAGFDLASKLLEKVADGSYSLYFFGGKPNVAQQAKENLQKKYPKLQVVGLQDGYFDEKKEQEIIQDIQEKKPDILFVCLGAPKQEKWIHSYGDTLGAKVCMGIGGSLDVFAGVAERAPLKYQQLGLEWLYRLMKQPSRFVRMLDLPKFGLTVFFKGKRVKKERVL